MCADGTRVRMHLFWPRSSPALSLVSLRFNRQVGWVLTVATARGLVDFFGWTAEVDHPTPVMSRR
jgi:hypothetical protein